MKRGFYVSLAMRMTLFALFSVFGTACSEGGTTLTTAEFADNSIFSTAGWDFIET